MKEFPKLPNNWLPNVVIPYGNLYYAFYQDGQYSHKFVWDGFAVSFNEHEIALSYRDEQIKRDS